MPNVIVWDFEEKAVLFRCGREGCCARFPQHGIAAYGSAPEGATFELEHAIGYSGHVASSLVTKFLLAWARCVNRGGCCARFPQHGIAA